MRILEITRFLAYPEAYAGDPHMTDQRHVKLVRNGRNQAVRKRGLLALLDSIEPIVEPFPDIDDGLPPLRDVKL